MSRGRRTIENTFGILASRFRIFRRPINCHVQTVVQITKAAVALHNFLICTRSPGEIHSYCPSNLIDQESSSGLIPGEWRQEVTEGMLPLRRTSSNNYSNDARIVRNDFKNYFLSPEGSVSWQVEAVTRTSLISAENV